MRQQQQRRHSSVVNNAIQPVVENLEKRRLLSASVVLNNINNPALGPADSTGVQQRPAVSFKGTGGVLAWTDDNASGGSGVDTVARRFDASGEWTRAPFTVNTTTGGDQASPAVAVADDGSFVIAWQRKLAATFRNLWLLLCHFRVAGLQPMTEVSLDNKNSPRLAYGLPIAVGALLTIWLH